MTPNPPLPSQIPLTADAVHVWYLFTDTVRDQGLLARLRDSLSPDERTRQQRFVFEQDRHQFLVAHGALRALLARYLKVEAAACCFEVNSFGRPSLGGAQRGALSFNISHTDGLIAFAFARQPELGVDVEALDRRPVDADLPRRFFSPAEVAALEALPEEARHSRFFDYWTLKESYIKARGMGLSLPLDGFTMHLERQPPRISFAPTIDDDASAWQFRQHDPSPRHRLALAVRRQGPDLTVQIRELPVSAL